ncbi:hypothetical protein [Streptomyces vietnamensis]|uniref:hypothetical protein n=1 Tax=Streptomyces vietnamensis TaxID=362257 RepID=UPI00131B4B27|nr:hypothetical protein [Streptomyces vietnamensis]
MSIAVQQAQVVVKALPGTTLDTIPAPYEIAGQGELSPQEEADFEACKAGVRNLQNAFWVAGKSLETIKTGNLQRRVHANFATFVWEEFEISEPQMHRLVEEWRVGQALSQLGWKPKESQVRELTGITKEAGDQTAVTVYDTIARNVKRVTAQVIRDVVAQLPPLRSASAAEVRQMVASVVAPPQPRTSVESGAEVRALPHAEDTEAAAPAASTAGAPELERPPAPTEGGQPVASPSTAGVGTGGEESGGGAPSTATDHPDVKKLIEAANLLEKAHRMLSPSLVRRAGEAYPTFTDDLITKMRAAGDGIGKSLEARTK